MRVYENFPSHAKNRSSRLEQNGTATLTGQNRKETLQLLSENLSRKNGGWIFAKWEVGIA